MGRYALARSTSSPATHAHVGEARGTGLMLGLELVDPATGEADSDAALAVQRAALERGLILELGGRGDAVVRLLPPLNVSRRTMDQALEILDDALTVAGPS